MDYALVAFPAAPVRKKAAHQSEMVSQLLFGEAVKVLKAKNDLWVSVRSLHDGYEGWLTHTLLAPVDKDTARQPVSFVTTGLLNTIHIRGTKMNIPAGSSLPGFEPGKKTGKGKLGNDIFEYAGPFLQRNQLTNKAIDQLLVLTEPWLNAPYLWGGRTPLGVDCSGFVQVIFRQLGIDLPRDAWQQAAEGERVKKISNAKTGDLLFFDNKEDIVHVGILSAPGQMIHASGKVKIDLINHKGIVNPDPRRKPLRLKAIRRFF